MSRTKHKQPAAIKNTNAAVKTYPTYPTLPPLLFSGANVAHPDCVSKSLPSENDFNHDDERWQLLTPRGPVLLDDTTQAHTIDSERNMRRDRKGCCCIL